MNNMKYIIDLIENNKVTNSNYGPIYLFTTENIRELLKSIDVSGKKVLTVSSNGDHIFNMLLSGASSIDSFDVNYLAKYYFYFKEAAVRTLSYKEFLKFFFNNFSFNSKVFDNEVFFYKILPNIRDEESARFWEYLFNRYGSRKLYNSNLFYNSYDKNTYIACNDYLRDEANYNALQQKLNNYKYTFYLMNIFKKITKLPKVKYGVIYLSNIFDKLVCRDKLKYIETLKITIHRLKKYLVPNGLLGGMLFISFL